MNAPTRRVARRGGLAASRCDLRISLSFYRFQRHLIRKNRMKSENSRTRRRHTEKFKREAVRLLHDTAQPVPRWPETSASPTICSTAGGRDNTRQNLSPPHANRCVPNSRTWRGGDEKMLFLVSPRYRTLADLKIPLITKNACPLWPALSTSCGFSPTRPHSVAERLSSE